MSNVNSLVARAALGVAGAILVSASAAAAEPVAVSNAVAGAEIAIATPVYRSALTGIKYFQRCDYDPLSNEEAIGRVYWYLQCYPARLKIDMENLQGEALEPQTAVEDYFAFLNFEQDASGSWVPKGTRVMYPIFDNGTETADGIWKAPTDKSAPCVAIPSGYLWRYTCRSSCYKPEMSLWFGEGDVAIKEAYDRGIDKVVVLDETATLDHPTFATVPVYSYTASDRDKQHDILSITTESGGNLKVTTNHPLIDELGYVREAETFTIGDALIRESGALDPIVNIEHEDYFGKVYNLMPNTESKLGNVVIAEGFLSGSEWYQNEASDLLNSKLLRANIPEDIL